MKLIIRGMGGSKNLMVTKGMGASAAAGIVKEIINIVSYINKTIEKSIMIKKIEDFSDIQIVFTKTLSVNSIVDLE